MAYRTILVHLDDNERSAARLSVAIGLAQRFGAELVGMYLQPSYEIYPFAAEMLPADFVQQSIEQRSEAQNAAAKAFADAATAASLPAYEFRAPAGDTYTIGTIHARYADLVVLGQPERGAGDYPFTNDLAHSLVMGSGRPVLLVPYAGTVTSLGERVLIGWKDTREAARAVSDAMPLLKEAKQLQAVAVSPKEEEGVEAFVAEKQLRHYFRRHGLEGTVRHIAAPDASAGEFLLSQAADAGADLIVMGGYSRRRIRELIWGGVTRTMLRSMTVPVLMSH